MRLQFIKKLNPFKSKTYFNKEGLIIKEAFVIAGVKYFEVDSIFKLPYERAMMAIRFYEEVKMKCDYDMLKAYTTAVDNIFKGKQIGFNEMAELKRFNDILRERLYNIVDTDLIYKLASVCFFDENESPFKYDYEYNQKKILKWKAEKNINDFFLQEPLQRLIPFLKSPEIDFQTYSQTVREITSFHWESLFTKLSTEQKKTFAGSKGFFANSSRQN